MRVPSPLGLMHVSTPAAPAAGRSRLHTETGDHLHLLTPGGTDRSATAVTGPAFVRKPSDTSTTSSAMADLPGLSFTVAAGVRYVFLFEGRVSNSSISSNAYLSINGPAIGADGLLYHGYTPASTTLKRNDSSTAYNTAMGPGSTEDTFETYWWQIRGFLHTGAAGTLTMRYRSNVATTTTTVYAGAHGLLWTVG